MALFSISDLHLSFGTDKPMDVFGRKWENYEEKLKTNWNNLVSKEDVVIVNGDNSWATYLEDTLEDFSFINSLNGTKLISKGNHDYWWSTMSKHTKWCEQNGFDTIKLDNYDEYISLTPCNKSEMNDQSLTIFGYCNFDNDFIIVENIDVKLEYNLHFYYINTSNEESMYVFINRQINIEISSNQTFFEITFSPYNNIEDYKAFKSFDFNCSVKAISGLITSEVSTNEKQ